ncbi:cobalt transport protein [Desulforamulus reducens MI-1]|uniref:Cobalt transport protein n=1 Tax=Desulforamulus reducens (strain ATCC BAA-1160 / DSM 100696 / MI-1) TaxID=349161 RepID=A4J143_DESRM|nr:energy-coupling factor transporter transmembrane component T [Desulforamulus reducens]ABO48796.1 cobalt transport protein [Desulforamulus reducens MI-1]
MFLFSNITVGQYYPTKSIIHHMDPRAKLLAMPLIIAAVLLANHRLGYLITATMVFLAVALARVPMVSFLRGMKFLWLFLLISLILQTLTYPGEVLWQWGFLAVSREGLLLGLKLAYQLTLLILTAMLLTMTTTPVNLTGALEKLFQPFKPLGLPAHELAMMMAIALRFIPTLLEEAEAIMKAQQARGGSIAAGKLGPRLKAAVALLVPLLAGSLRRADELALAMEARCYRGDQGRTKLKQYQYKMMDFLILIVVAVITAMVILNRWGII